MFTIQTDTLRLELGVAPVDALLRHEEVLPEVVEDLAIEFGNWANLENPVIVDENHIVLDGNHRTHVFKQLNFTYIPVCRIDYFNDAVQLRYWFRVLGRITDPGLIQHIVGDMGGEFVEVADRKTLQSLLLKHRLCLGIHQGGRYCLIRFSEALVTGAVSAYRVLEELQSRLTEAGAELKYIPCQSVLDEFSEMKVGDSEAALWTPHITKDMVVNAAKREKVFSPKATRHLIPARPLNVNVPLHWFRENLSLKEMNERFFAFLKQKGVKRFGPGQVIGGRYYEEELFVFFDK